MPGFDSALTLLCLLGVLQGLLLAVALGSLGGEYRRANRLLGLLCLGAATVLALILVSHRWGPVAAGRAELLEYAMWPFSGPLLLLYVSLVAGRDRWPPRAFTLHFLPGGALLVYFLVALGTGGLLRFPGAQWMMLHQATYTVLSFLRYQAHRPEATHWGIHRFWVPTLLLVVALQHAAQLVRWLFRHEPVLRDVVPVTGAACFVVVTLIGLRRALPFVARSGRRYAGSSLAPDRAEEVAERLRQLMETDRPHLRPELTLDDLAGALGVPKTHLSQILNETVGQSFLDFLAGYRVRESERLLRDEGSRHLTIEAVGHDSGFRSRSAFYEAFRRANGMTPAEFRRREGDG